MRPHSFSGLATIADRNSTLTGASKEMTKIGSNGGGGGVGIEAKTISGHDLSGLGLGAPASL